MNEKPIDFVGKWKVEKLERNGQLIDENAWVTDSTAWKNVYIEEHGGVALSTNPYVFEPNRAKRAMFKYNNNTHRIDLTIIEKGKPADSMLVMITKKTKEVMEWSGTSKSNNFKIWLKKEKTTTH